MADVYDFSGIWHSKYRVPAGSDKKIVEVEHDFVMYRHGDHLVLETLPKEDGSYMLARFTIDGRIITGTYHSQNSQQATAKGASYYGAAQLVLDEDGNTLRGEAVGFGRDMKVKMSEWTLSRVHHPAK